MRPFMFNKVQTTSKQIKVAKPFVFAVPYCAVQQLLKYQDPALYNTGAQGWNCDFYPTSHPLAGIVTGYNPYYACTHTMPNDICRKYEGLALELAQSATSVKDITKEYDDLIVQMLDETFIALGLPNIFDDNNLHNKDC